MTDDELHRLARGCLLLGWTGRAIPPWLSAALDGGLAGVVLFGSNIGDGLGVRALTDELRRQAGRPLVIATDEEGGDVTRLDAARGSTSPGAAALGALDEVETTEAVYAAIGERLVAAGITLNQAPVADVNNNPANPVIGLRSFHSDPAVVERHVVAAVRGLQGVGIAACVKHFPGHGDTATDSHTGHPVIAVDRARLEAVELAPFRAAIAAGTAAIMTAHLSVPALDPDRLVTVSPLVNTALLRNEFGFTGAILTDALEMQALADGVGMLEGFVQALIAGADTIQLGARDYPELAEQIPIAVAQAVHDGRLPIERLQAAAATTARLAVPPDRRAAEATSDDRARSAARRSITVSGPALVPFRPELPVVVVECRTPNGEATGALPWSLTAPLRAAGVDVLERSVDSAESAALVGSELRSQAGFAVLVVRDPQRHRWQAPLIDALTSRPAESSVLVDVGWPSGLNLDGVPMLTVRGIAPPLLAAAAEVIAMAVGSTDAAVVVGGTR